MVTWTGHTSKKRERVYPPTPLNVPPFRCPQSGPGVSEPGRVTTPVTSPTGPCTASTSASAEGPCAGDPHRETCASPSGPVLFTPSPTSKRTVPTVSFIDCRGPPDLGLHRPGSGKLTTQYPLRSRRPPSPAPSPPSTHPLGHPPRSRPPTSPTRARGPDWNFAGCYARRSHLGRSSRGQNGASFNFHTSVRSFNSLSLRSRNPIWTLSGPTIPRRRTRDRKQDGVDVLVTRGEKGGGVWDLPRRGSESGIRVVRTQRRRAPGAWGPVSVSRLKRRRRGETVGNGRGTGSNWGSPDRSSSFPPPRLYSSRPSGPKLWVETAIKRND